MKNEQREIMVHSALLLVLLAAFGWSLINPFDLFTWFLEILPVVLGVAILLVTYRKFRLTNLAYILIWIHAIILVIGAHYTYANVPAFNWLKEAFQLSRNHYDRLGHFAQGFVPAILARELLLRNSPLRKGKWLFFLVLCVCLSISASYELIEWAVAELTGTSADMFLSTQGDVWDTQKDMAMAFIGAVSSLLLLGTVHDRQLSLRMKQA